MQYRSPDRKQKVVRKEVKAVRRLRELAGSAAGKAAMVNAGVGFIIVMMARVIAGVLQNALPGGAGTGSGSPTNELNALFNNLLNIGTGVALAACALFIAWGAFLYMTAEGNPARMERG
jgi:hypothetical protein